MPNTREKLIELFGECHKKCQSTECDECEYYKHYRDCDTRMMIDHLIANGVTVQECGHWEDDHGDYVCSCCCTVFTDDLVWLVRGESNEPNYCPHCGAKMMPQPPKGE